MIRDINLIASLSAETRYSSIELVENILGKKWSYSYVYDLKELRDIYLVVKQYGFIDLKSFSNLCEELNIEYARTKWSQRRILEHLNALKNFGLTNNNNQVVRSVFIDRSPKEPLSKDDLLVFRDIYFNYFRFKELFIWFLDTKCNNGINTLTEEIIRKQSKPLYSFSSGNSRFTDSFFTNLIATPSIRVIPKYPVQNCALMRFWDVFIKWGKELGVLEKFSLSSLGINTHPQRYLSCTYIINDVAPEIDILEYAGKEFKSNYVYLPELVFLIAKEYRFSIHTIHEELIKQYKKNKEKISLERTSEIFIKKSDVKKGEIILFPKYNDSYISHMRIRT